MSFSLTTIALLLLSCSGFQTKASAPIAEMNDIEFDGTPLEKFKIHITEKGTKFAEKIYIDKKNDIEYFKVPAHNGLEESDNLYDFKMNITVRRVKKERVCHVSPLPEDLPTPGLLSQGLKSMSNTPPSHNIKKVKRQWMVGPKIDKTTLRKEVQDFCGSFPIYRLEPYSLDSVSVGNGKTTRTKRYGTRKVTLCEGRFPSRNECSPDDWLYSCKIKSSRCVYYITCNLNSQRKMFHCGSLTKHRYDSLVCCTPTCP